MRKNLRKVIIAMSGGVDSSVAAALLKKRGFDVVGIFMKFWKPKGPDSKNRCCSPESEKKARKIAKILNIPFYVFNFEKEFKKKIIDYFLEEHKLGRTPNPCVVCNKEIKFGLLLEKALKLDADFIATGHYARIKVQNSKFKMQNDNSKFKIFKLLKAKDRNKDQSYFLWQLNQKQLRHILFPIGDYTKNQVRKLAQKFKLPVRDISESQEVCFIQTTVNDFLRNYLRTKSGNIIDEKGNILGEHQGLWFYTIGQRRGINLPGGPYYVIDKDIKRNTLVVSKNEKALLKKELIAKDINWILGKPPRLPLRVMVKIRYKHKPALATILKEKNDKIKAVFDKPQRAITPGQSAVFYLKSEVIGGGIIEK